MPHARASIHPLTRPKQGPILVGVQIEPHDRLVGRLLDRFNELRWQVVDLNAFNLQLPGRVKFAGALVRSLPTDPMAQRLLERSVPTVRLGRLPHTDDERMPAVIPDLLATGRLAAVHFAERGFASSLGGPAQAQPAMGPQPSKKRTRQRPKIERLIKPAIARMMRVPVC